MGDRITHRFSSPSDYEANSNSKTVIVYDQVLRTFNGNDIKMAGVFCKESLEPGEFICAWNGVNLIESPTDTQNLINGYDFSNYGLEFPKGNQIIISCPRLDKNGKPLKPSPSLDKRDLSMAVFLNEPSPTQEAVLVLDKRKFTPEEKAVFSTMDPGTPGIIRLKNKTRNLANVCLDIHKQRNGVIVPIVFAKRKIQVGEELTWEYGGQYLRTHYEFDRKNDSYIVHEGYEAVSTGNSACSITCETVFFEKPIEISTFNSRMFMAGEWTEEDILDAKFRTQKYFEHMKKAAKPENKKRKQRDFESKSVVRKTIQMEDIQNRDMKMYMEEYRKFSSIAQGVIDSIRLLKHPNKKSGTFNKFLYLMLKHIVLPCISDKRSLDPDELTWISPNVSKRPEKIVLQKNPAQTNLSYFLRPVWALRKVDADKMIKDDDINWKYILKMQLEFFNVLKSILQGELKSFDNFEGSFGPFEPNRYTRKFMTSDNRPETVDDWNSESFQEENALAFRISSEFFKRMYHLQKNVNFFKTLYIMYEKLKTKFSPLTSESPILLRFLQKCQMMFELAILFVETNAIENVLNDWFSVIITVFFEKALEVQPESFDIGLKKLIVDVTTVVDKLQTIKRNTIVPYTKDGTQVELGVADVKFLDKILSIVKTVDEISLTEVSPWRSEGLASEIKYLSSQSNIRRTKNIDTIFLISNKLSKQVCEKAMKVSPQVKCMETENDRLYNGMVLLLYPNRTTFAAFKTQMENACYVFRTSENRIHHILHVVCCVNNEYEILAWKSSAGPQTFETHRFLQPALRDVLDETLSA